MGEGAGTLQAYHPRTYPTERKRYVVEPITAVNVVVLSVLSKHTWLSYAG